MKQRQTISARRVVITSFVVDVTDVIFNIVAAVLSGSVVVLTEALQGFADLITSGLLWIGVSRSKRRASKTHKFGRGKELFFWILMAGVSMFVVTAGFSFYFGINRLLHPQPIHNTWFAFVAMAVGLCTNLYALNLSRRRLGVKWRQGFGGLVKHIRGSALIETKATGILDLMGSAAAFLGLCALGVYAITGDTRFDGIGAMVVGVVCGAFALLLIMEVKAFIIGRSASEEVESEIKRVAEKVEGVRSVLDLRTMQMGSERILVNLEVHVDQALTTLQIESLTDEVKQRVKRTVPQVQHIQVEIETPSRRAITPDTI